MNRFFGCMPLSLTKAFALDGSPSLVGIFGGGFHVLFGALLWVQTLRVRCVFEKDSFEFYNVKGPKCDLNKGAKLVKKPDNYVAGTVNRWDYDKITNYGFFPSDEYPVICYFKECVRSCESASTLTTQLPSSRSVRSS